MVGAQVSQNQKAIDTIDILRDYQYGRNGSIEYKWSNFAPERYVQLYYQIAHDYPDPEIASKVREKIISEYRYLQCNAEEEPEKAKMTKIKCTECCCKAETERKERGYGL